MEIKLPYMCPVPSKFNYWVYKHAIGTGREEGKNSGKEEGERERRRD